MQVVIFLAVFTSVAYAPREVLTGWLAHGRRPQPGDLPPRGLARRRARPGSDGRAVAGAASRWQRPARAARHMGRHRPRDPRPPVGSRRWRSTACRSTSRSPPTWTGWRRVPPDLEALYREMEGDESAQMMTHPDLGRSARGARAGDRRPGGARGRDLRGHLGGLDGARRSPRAGASTPSRPTPTRADRAEAFLARGGARRTGCACTAAPAAGDPPGAARRRLRPLLHRRRQDRLLRPTWSRPCGWCARGA